MAKEGDENSTNKRSEGPMLLDAEVPSSKRPATLVDFSTLSSQEAPRKVGDGDNITETNVPDDLVTPDPYELTPLDLGDQLEELDDDEIKFTYKTVTIGDTIGLEKAMNAKLDDIKRLNLDYQYVFEKIKEAQSETQRHPKSLVTVYWCNNRVGYIITGVLMEDRWS